MRLNSDHRIGSHEISIRSELKILPGHRAVVRGDGRPTEPGIGPHTDEFYAPYGISIDSIWICGPTHARDWIVHGLSIDGKPQFAKVDIPGLAFDLLGHRSSGGSRRGHAAIHMANLDPIMETSAVEVDVTYVGSNPAGERLTMQLRGIAAERTEFIDVIGDEVGSGEVTRIKIPLPNVFRPIWIEIESASQWEAVYEEGVTPSQLRDSGAWGFMTALASAKLWGKDDLYQMVLHPVDDTVRPPSGVIEFDVRYVGAGRAAFRGRMEGTTATPPYAINGGRAMDYVRPWESEQKSA